MVGFNPRGPYMGLGGRILRTNQARKSTHEGVTCLHLGRRSVDEAGRKEVLPASMIHQCPAADSSADSPSHFSYGDWRCSFSTHLPHPKRGQVPAGFLMGGDLLLLARLKKGASALSCAVVVPMCLTSTAGLPELPVPAYVLVYACG